LTEKRLRKILSIFLNIYKSLKDAEIRGKLEFIGQKFKKLMMIFTEVAVLQLCLSIIEKINFAFFAWKE
jgi:hypothetical protein